MAGLSAETLPTPSDGTYGVGNVKLEKDRDMKEEVEVNVKAEKGIGSEVEDCIDIKDEDGMYSAEEQEEVEDICTKEEEKVDMQDAVS
jgi:hypothetical protein